MKQRTSIVNIFGKPNLKKRIYVVRCGTEIKYVGKAGKQCVANRMALHIGHVFSANRPSAFSRLLLENHPDYFAWKIDIFDIVGANRLTKLNLHCLSCAEREVYEFYKAKNKIKPVGNSVAPHRCRRAYAK